MPIFMDRHDMKGTRPEDVAQDHLKDLEVQDRYGVKWLTYWFDQERGTTFCLVDAPDKETAERAHREAHGHVAGEIIEVSLSAVEAFLGRISDPKPGTGSTRIELGPGIRTIMFTDIVGSTEMTARVGDRMAIELVRAHDALVRRALSRWGGREVKHTGDGIMASFDTSSAAAGCARTIQQAFASYNVANAEPIHVRIGLHAGEPLEDNNDLFGSTVQLASRLCGVAAADQILVSQQMRDGCENPHEFIDLGSRSLKGFPQLVQVFECHWRSLEEAKAAATARG
jgi:class 3 adenylate cyclase